MEYLVVVAVSLLISALALLSGFGLGTVLMPAFALFFPVPVAISATAIVHLANNVFKVILVGRNADLAVVARFAIPGAVAAMIGAALLGWFAGIAPLHTFSVAGAVHEITAVKLVIGMLVLGFAAFELSPRLSRLSFDQRYLPLGGSLSGFFGGLSGNQGALRSVFLIKAGLSKKAFIGTGTLSALVVDVARLLVYGLGFYSARFAQVAEISGLVLVATLAAFLGAFLGSRWIEKVTLRTIRLMVGGLLTGIGGGMAVGLI